MRTRQTLNVLVVTLLLFASAMPSRSEAGFGEVCSVIFKKVEPRFNDPATSRADVTQFLAENRQVPAFLKRTANGDVPVILLTVKTYPHLRELLQKSMGTMFAQQVGYRNDHGLLRVSDYVIDADLPGYRGFGEIHATGLAWKELKPYLGLRLAKEQTAYNMVEVGYVLTPKELETAKFYQVVRRAAIIRVPFSLARGQDAGNQPNMLSTSEHCFVFCKGSAASSHIREMKEQMRQLGVSDADQFMQLAPVRSFLAAARRDAVDLIDSHDPERLHWGMFHQPALMRTLDEVLPPKLDDAGKKVLVNWMIGLDATTQYEELRRTLGMTGDLGYADMRSPRASFVLMYGKTTDAPSFNDATFSSQGVFTNWTSEGQTPISDLPEAAGL